MVADWELSDAQIQAAAKRQEVAGWQAILDRLDQQRELAASAEASFGERCAAIKDRMGAIRHGPHPIRLVGSGVRPDVISGPDDVALREYAALEQQLGTLEAERRRWLDDHTVRWLDGGLQRSYNLTVSGVDGQRGRVRVALGVASSQLAALEDRLSAGERCEIGRPAGEYLEHRQRVEALRRRTG